MGTSAVFSYSVSTFFLGFSAFLSILSFSRNLPLLSVAVAVTLGLISGIVVGGAIADRELRYLSEKGEFEFRPNLVTILIIAGSILFLIVVGLYFYAGLSLETQTTVLDFVYPLTAAVSATFAFLFAGWEKKFHAMIFADNFRLYVLPKTDNAPPPSQQQLPIG